MRTNALDKAVRAQGGFVVKPHQVKAMILAARRAYDIQAKAGLVDDGVGFDAWRRATLHDVVGGAAPSSFRAVTQRDYRAVMRYFLALAGGGFIETALPSGGRAGSMTQPTETTADERRRALWSLARVEGEVAGAFGGRGEAARYADALFGKIHRTDRGRATARQIWAVIFTLRNRAAGRRAKTPLGARGASGAHLPSPEGSKRFPAFSRGL